MKQRTIHATTDPSPGARAAVWTGGNPAYRQPPAVVLDVRESDTEYANIYLTPAESKLLRRALRKAERTIAKATRP